MKAVLVKWNDITCYADRKTLQEAVRAKLTPAETIGELIFEDKQMVVVAHNIFHIPETEPYVSEFTAIPKGCITKIVRYKGG